MNPLIQSKNATILPVLIALTLGCFGLSPQARAVCQEGCLTNQNTVLGEDALLNNTTGFFNTATGVSALYGNTTGIANTANGAFALQGNTTGTSNTANGAFALQGNTTGGINAATGFQALNQNTTGGFNTATGGFALFSNTTGRFNTATGALALNLNTTGLNNTATGVNALLNNTTGNSNIALGNFAGSNLTTGDNNIDIGNPGVAAEANTIRIGTPGTHTASYIAGIVGTTTPRGTPVFINANGQLGTVASSARFKDAINPMDKASEAILALQPVTFHYKQKLDPEGIPQFGLVAEDVEKVNPDLVVRDADGKPYTVRYEAVNAMLLNEFLKEHQKVQRLEAALAAVNERLKAQDAKIDKVNAKVELTKSAPQMVVNDQ
jgi:hypothetical protein